eukprot:14895979-Alexandrium_andersonii.AAC.1
MPVTPRDGPAPALTLKGAMGNRVAEADGMALGKMCLPRWPPATALERSMCVGSWPAGGLRGFGHQL